MNEIKYTYDGKRRESDESWKNNHARRGHPPFQRTEEIHSADLNESTPLLRDRCEFRRYQESKLFYNLSFGSKKKEMTGICEEETNLIALEACSLEIVRERNSQRMWDLCSEKYAQNGSLWV